MRQKKTTNYFKSLSRKDYIIKTSDIISKEGVKAVSIRRIATELNCSSTSMYRYFKNQDELLFYAQLDALNEYILRLSTEEKKWENDWDMVFGIWRAYAIEAFRNPEAFECIFYRNIEKDLGQALKDYYEMFPDTIIKVSSLVKEMLQKSEYYTRDYVIWQRVVDKNEISEENARKLNHIFCNLFLGYFKVVQERGYAVKDPEALADQFVEEEKLIATLYWNEGIAKTKSNKK